MRVTADRRPPLWPRLDQLTLVEDRADVVAAAPCNIVRGMSYGVTPQLRAPLQKAAGDGVTGTVTAFWRELRGSGSFMDTGPRGAMGSLAYGRGRAK
jgi:hypothetical protein